MYRIWRRFDTQQLIMEVGIVFLIYNIVYDEYCIWRVLWMTNIALDMVCAKYRPCGPCHRVIYITHNTWMLYHTRYNSSLPMCDTSMYCIFLDAYYIMHCVYISQCTNLRSYTQIAVYSYVIYIYIIFAVSC